MLLITLAALVALGQAPPLTKAEQLLEAARKGDAATVRKLGESLMATPAISDGLIIFRGLTNVYAIKAQR